MKTRNDALTDKDKNLMEAADMFQKNWVAKYPDKAEFEGKFVYSKRHIKRMNRLLNNYDSWVYRATCTTKRQVVVALLVILIGFNTLMITNVEARTAVVNFVVTVYEKFSDVLFPNDSAPASIVDYYEPTYIPTGYSVDSIDEGNKEFWIDYQSSNGDIISFIQAILGESELKVDTENSEFEVVAINEVEGLIVYNKERYLLSWSNTEYRFSLIGDDKAEIIKMAESLKILEKN